MDWRGLLIREMARTVRAALESWPQTARFCLLMAVATLALASIALTVYLIRR